MLKFLNPSRILAGCIASATLLPLAHCTEEGEDNTALLAAAVVLALPNCVLGNASFFAAGPSCNGTSASGSGTLTAASPTISQLSLELELDFSAGNGNVIVYAQAGNPLSTGGTFTIAQSGSIVAKGPTGSATTTGTPTGGSGTYCIEVHDDGGNTHLIIQKVACASASAAAWNDDAADYDPATAGAVAGKRWGMLLTNVRIARLQQITSGEIWSD